MDRKPRSRCDNAVVMKGLKWIAAGVLLAGLTTGLTAQSKEDEIAGAALFRKSGCEHCHGVNGVGTKKAPSLEGISRDKFWTPAKMTDQILNGGEKMPPFSDSLTDPEIAQIVAYLRAKKRPPLPGPVPADAAPADAK
jgi:mono/diheme cytochrome c family protein